MKALILAGGLGLRMKDTVDPIPKVMAPIADKPFLEHVVWLLRSKGVDEFVLAVGYKSNHVERYFGNGKKLGVGIEYSYEDEPLGTGGAVMNARKHLDGEGEFIVLNGDTYHDFDVGSLKKFHNGHGNVASMIMLPLGYGETTSLEYHPKTGRITSLSEVSVGEDVSKMVNAGIYMLSDAVFTYFPEELTKISLEKEFFPDLVKKGEIYAWEGNGDYYEIGTPERYNRAVKELPKILAQ